MKYYSLFQVYLKLYEVRFSPLYTIKALSFPLTMSSHHFFRAHSCPI
jgi:hypothetical protein